MPNVTTLHRRRLVSRLLALLSFAAVAPFRTAAAQPRAPLEVTPRDAEGPFYPRRIPADADHDLTRVAGRAARAEGTPLALSTNSRSFCFTPLTIGSPSQSSRASKSYSSSLVAAWWSSAKSSSRL